MKLFIVNLLNIYFFSGFMMKLILVSCFSVFLFFLSCDTNEPLPEGGLGLTLEEVSCTEAWITLTAGNLPSTSFIKITNNGNLLETIHVNSTKTLLYYDSLKPNTTYEFQAFSSLRGEDVIGNKLLVTTLDTTSHDFTWQTFEFGQHSSSVLYDVAIIDKNNIWAVGEIYMNDSLGNPDPMPYNAAHWGGSDWELKKIAVTYNGIETIAPLKGIFVLSSGEIIFSSGLPYLPQGNGWKLYHLWDMGVLDQNDGSVDRIWGTSINDLYFGDGKGTIVHYQNGSWTKIESGTTTNINDAWGIELGNGEQLVLCSVSNLFDPGDYKVLKIVNNKVDSISWRSGRRVSSTWFNSKNKIFTSGGGVFVSTAPGYLWREQIEIPLIYTDRVRGMGLNDVFVVGDFGLVAHFNGLSWKLYNEHLADIYYSCYDQIK